MEEADDLMESDRRRREREKRDDDCVGVGAWMGGAWVEDVEVLRSGVVGVVGVSGVGVDAEFLRMLSLFMIVGEGGMGVAGGLPRRRTRW